MSTNESNAIVVNAPIKTQHQKTIIVLGCSRGGTSMVSGVLCELGIFMGENLSGGGSYEDTDFIDKPISDIQQTINKRNSQFDIWGWKYPHTIDYIYDIIQTIRNPYFIVVFRNEFSVARSFSKYHTQIPFKKAIIEAHVRYGKIVQFISKNSYPTIAFSFEQALSDKKDFIDSLIKFLNLNTSKANKQFALSFINKKAGYQATRPSQKSIISITEIKDSDLKNYLYKPVAFDLIESKNVIIKNEKFYSTSNDPQLIYRLKELKNFPTQIFFSFEFHTSSPKSFNSLIYLGDKKRFDQEKSCSFTPSQGKNTILIQSKQEIEFLRFDPINMKDLFLLSNQHFFVKAAE